MRFVGRVADCPAASFVSRVGPPPIVWRRVATRRPGETGIDSGENAIYPCPLPPVRGEENPNGNRDSALASTLDGARSMDERNPVGRLTASHDAADPKKPWSSPSIEALPPLRDLTLVTEEVDGLNDEIQGNVDLNDLSGSVFGGMPF